MAHGTNGHRIVQSATVGHLLLGTQTRPPSNAHPAPTPAPPIRTSAPAPITSTGNMLAQTEERNGSLTSTSSAGAAAIAAAAAMAPRPGGGPGRMPGGMVLPHAHQGAYSHPSYTSHVHPFHAYMQQPHAYLSCTASKDPSPQNSAVAASYYHAAQAVQMEYIKQTAAMGGASPATAFSSSSPMPSSGNGRHETLEIMGNSAKANTTGGALLTSMGEHQYLPHEHSARASMHHQNGRANHLSHMQAQQQHALYQQYQHLQLQHQQHRQQQEQIEHTYRQRVLGESAHSAHSQQQSDADVEKKSELSTGKIMIIQDRQQLENAYYNQQQKEYLARQRIKQERKARKAAAAAAAAATGAAVAVSGVRRNRPPQQNYSDQHSCTRESSRPPQHPETVRFVLPDVFPGQHDPKLKKEQRVGKLQEVVALHKTNVEDLVDGKDKENARDVSEISRVSSVSETDIGVPPRQPSSASVKAGQLCNVIIPLKGWNEGAVSSEVETQLGGLWEDPRRCCLCKMSGDDPFLGRLLLLEEKERVLWIHLNCASWSSEVVEMEGSLYHVHAAKSRSKNLKCAACHVSGATVGCNAPGCKENYHFICAVARGCAFFEDRRVYCKSHFAAGFHNKGGRLCRALSSLDLLEPAASIKIVPAVPNQPKMGAPLSATVSIDASGVRAVDGWKDGKVLRVGALTVHDLGSIVEESPFFHTPKYIFPRGYRASRIFWSAKRAHARTLWNFLITAHAKDEELRREEGMEEPGRGNGLERASSSELEAEEDIGSSEGMVEKPWFQIVAMDDPDCVYAGPELEGVYAQVLRAVKARQVGAMETLRTSSAGRMDGAHGCSDNGAAAACSSADEGSGSGVASLQRGSVPGVPKVPARPQPCVQRKVPGEGSKVLTYGLSAFDFTGLGNPTVKRFVEGLQGAAVTALHRKKNLGAERAGAGDSDGEEEAYQFCYTLPDKTAVKRALCVIEKVRRRYLTEDARCAREDNKQVYAEVAARMARANRVRIAEEVEYEVGGPGSAPEGGGKAHRKGEGGVEGNQGEGVQGGPSINADNRSISQLYRELKAVPFSQRLLVKRSRIHGWGLFAKEPIKKDTMVAEYIGEVVRACVADLREKQYEESGQGSCYLFRLDRYDIVDATMQGNMARFVNHCCDPNCYARIISVDTGEKKIIFLAKRDIAAGEEVSYNYHFSLEDEKIPCYCGASTCVGSMN